MVLWDVTQCTLVEGNVTPCTLVEGNVTPCTLIEGNVTPCTLVEGNVTPCILVEGKLKFTIVRISNLIWQVVLVHSMKVYGVVEALLHSFLTSVLDRDAWSVLCPNHFIIEEVKKPLVPTEKRAALAPELVRTICRRKFSSLLGVKPFIHTCYTIQLIHYSHFKTYSLQHLKPIKC
jgi:hypothetical protein